MPIPGADIYHQLQTALDQQRAAVAEQKRNVDVLDHQLNELVARKGAALLELAQHYLPEFSRSSIEATFAEVRASLLEILGRKERIHAELTARAGRFVDTCHGVGDRSRRRDAAAQRTRPPPRRA